jgi:hypothetical protein
MTIVFGLYIVSIRTERVVIRIYTLQHDTDDTFLNLNKFIFK